MNHCAQRCASGLIRLLVCAIAWLSLPSPQAQAGVQISLHLDAESVELIRALRRAQGLDPPDAEADQRVAALLQRRQAQKQPAAQSKMTTAVAADAAGSASAQTMAALAQAAVASQFPATQADPAAEAAVPGVAEHDVIAPRQTAEPVASTAAVSAVAAEVAAVASAQAAMFMETSAAQASAASGATVGQPTAAARAAADAAAIAASSGSAATAAQLMMTLLTEAAADASLEIPPVRAPAADQPRADTASPLSDQLQLLPRP